MLRLTLQTAKVVHTREADFVVLEVVPGANGWRPMETNVIMRVTDPTYVGHVAVGQQFYFDCTPVTALPTQTVNGL